MAWIRKNPHLLALLLVALGVLAASAVVAMNAQGYDEKFAQVQQTVTPGEKFTLVDYTRLDQTQKELDEPVKWVSPKDPDPKSAGEIFPFVPHLYSIEGDRPLKSGEGFHWKDRLTQKPIPDRWFLENNLPVTEAAVGVQDPDGDGFLNEDEWRAGTDPNSKTSHPPYYSKLFLKRIDRVAFRLLFQAYDGDPAKPESMTFQINTLDVRAPSEFLSVGATVPNTKYKIEKFESKSKVNASTQSEEDVSELTVRNTETNDVVPLVLHKVVNSPDVYAVFSYLWPKPALEIRVGKTKKFVLLPEKDQFYILVDITDEHAVIKTPAGEEKEILRPPAGYP